jgi:hypothetical protein
MRLNNYSTADYVCLSVSKRNQLTWFKILLLKVYRPITELMGLLEIPTSQNLQVPTFNGSIELKYLPAMVLLLAGLLMTTTFGGIHCIAWFFAFPTCQEQVLWRMSAVAITCTPWSGFCLEYIPLAFNISVPL